MLSFFFFLIWSLLRVLYPKHVSQFQRLKNIPFQILLFLTPFSMYTRTSTVGKKWPFYLFSWYPPLNTSAPPPYHRKRMLNLIPVIELNTTKTSRQISLSAWCDFFVYNIFALLQVLLVCYTCWSKVMEQGMGNSNGQYMSQIADAI